MTRNDSRGPLAPHDNAHHGGQEGPTEAIRDPLMAITENVGDDPSVAKLVASGAARLTFRPWPSTPSAAATRPAGC